jgi:hypothetical protein
MEAAQDPTILTLQIEYFPAISANSIILNQAQGLFVNESGMRRLFYIFLVALLFFCSGNASADWIKAEFSEKANIDSLERFLVIPDTDSNLYFGQQIVSLGDINHDNISDILIQRWAGLATADNRAFLFYGGAPPDSIYDREFLDFLPYFENIGDINGDGYDDIGMMHFYSFSPFHIDIEFYFGGPSIDDSADFVIPNMLSYVTRAADLDNDGHLDIPLSVEFNDSTIVKIYHIDSNRDTLPEYIIKDTSKAFGNNLATGHFNGDDYPDLAVAAYGNRDSCFVKFYWGGPAFDTIPDFEIYDFSSNFGEILLPLGDFNADGYGDIFISGSDDQHPFGVYFGGPDIDDKMDLILNKSPSGFGYYPPNSASLAGDINNDGYQDLILGFSAQLVFIHEITVFLGGPDVDTIPDVYIENQHIPGGQIDFGDEVAGIGDFNGDDVDDFAVRSKTSSFSRWQGEVNFFAGWVSYICGDIDSDGLINMLDILYLISYLYKGGAAPGTPEGADVADVNNDNSVNMLDILYLIAYLYKGGPEPVCN